LQLLPLLSSKWGIHAVISIFSSVSLCATLFIARFVPETKGKTIETILANL